MVPRILESVDSCPLAISLPCIEFVFILHVFGNLTRLILWKHCLNMALKAGYGIFLLWSYSLGAVVQTFTSTMITGWNAYCAVRLTTLPLERSGYLVSFFLNSDIVWLKVTACPCITYMSKKNQIYKTDLCTIRYKASSGRLCTNCVRWKGFLLQLEICKHKFYFKSEESKQFFLLCFLNFFTCLLKR